MDIEPTVTSEAAPGAFCIAADKAAAKVFVDVDDYPGVLRAAKDLQADVARVTEIKPALVHKPDDIGQTAILIGTLGHS
jgi:hypothetical protein